MSFSSCPSDAPVQGGDPWRRGAGSSRGRTPILLGQVWWARHDSGPHASGGGPLSLDHSQAGAAPRDGTLECGDWRVRRKGAARAGLREPRREGAVPQHHEGTVTTSKPTGPEARVHSRAQKGNYGTSKRGPWGGAVIAGHSQPTVTHSGPAEGTEPEEEMALLPSTPVFLPGPPTSQVQMKARGKGSPPTQQRIGVRTGNGGERI